MRARPHHRKLLREVDDDMSCSIRVEVGTASLIAAYPRGVGYQSQALGDYPFRSACSTSAAADGWRPTGTEPSRAAVSERPIGPFDTTERHSRFEIHCAERNYIPPSGTDGATGDLGPRQGTCPAWHPGISPDDAGSRDPFGPAPAHAPRPHTPTGYANDCGPVEPRTGAPVTGGAAHQRRSVGRGVRSPSSGSRWSRSTCLPRSLLPDLLSRRKVAGYCVYQALHGDGKPCACAYSGARPATRLNAPVRKLRATMPTTSAISRLL